MRRDIVTDSCTTTALIARLWVGNTDEKQETGGGRRQTCGSLVRTRIDLASFLFGLVDMIEASVGDHDLINTVSVPDTTRSFAVSLVLVPRSDSVSQLCQHGGDEIRSTCLTGNVVVHPGKVKVHAVVASEVVQLHCGHMLPITRHCLVVEGHPCCEAIAVLGHCVAHELKLRQRDLQVH